MSAHSAGPWTHQAMTMPKKAWAALGKGLIQIVAKDGNVIAAVWSAGDLPGEVEANATLIATAPQMLEAAQEAWAGLVAEHGYAKTEARFGKLRAAIEKSTGAA